MPSSPVTVASKKSWSLSRFVHEHVSEVWMRFALALMGLALAFGAALFSTVSRESGDLWATLVLASIALLLATVVGLTTVPYLARRVAIARVRDSFDYDVTRVGIVYVLVAVVIGIAALNTGNNLLYIIVSAMLAAIFISGVASAITLNELELDVRLPEHVFAARRVAASIVLRNHGRWPSFSVSVVPPKQAEARKTDIPGPTGADSSTPIKPSWFRLGGGSRPGQGPAPAPAILRGSIYFPYLAGHSEARADLDLHFGRRGRYQQDNFGLSTRFPFSFLTKTRRVALARELIVYPPIEPPDEFFEVLPLITGEFESFVRGRGYDLYRIRDYMPEDSARHLDWKSTAKAGSPKVREFTREDERKLRLVFDNPDPGVISEKRYETAVGLAASLAWHFSAEADTDINFAAQDYAGGPDVYRFLAFLALIQPKRETSVIEQLHATDDYNVILTTRAHGTIPTPLWSCSYFIFLKD